VEITEQNGRLLRFSQRYEFPESVAVNVGDLRFSIESKAHTGNERRRQFQIAESHRVKAQSDAYLPLGDWVDQVVRPWRDLVSFGTRVPNRIVELTAYYPDELPADEQGRRGFPIVYSGLEVGTVPDDFLLPDEMLFQLADVRAELPIMLDRAFSIAGNGGSAQDLYYQVCPSERRVSIEDQFFGLIRSLEAYHREHRQVDEVPASEHQGRVDAVLAGIPSDVPSEFREWVIGKLQYPNEPHLRKRLTDLVKEWSDLTNPLLPNRDRRESFVSLVVSTRNCFAHGTEPACGQAATSCQLRFITSVLTILATAQALLDLGIEQRRCVELIRSRSWYQLLVQRNQRGG
jgi:hypothetical protein